VRIEALVLTSISILLFSGSNPPESSPGRSSENHPSDFILVENRLKTSVDQPAIWDDFDGKKALAEANALAGYGPRPAGSESNARLRAYLTERLKQLGWQVTEQRFTEHDPDGKQIEFCNLIAQFPGATPSEKRVLIGAHFDTIPSQEFKATGATDGAANSAMLVELAAVIAPKPAMAAQVELLFFDGDAPFRELNLSDGLFGSRFYVQTLRASGQTQAISEAILLRNTGSGVLNYAPNGDKAVIDQLKVAARIAGFNLEPANRMLLADQIPFLQAGIPSVALLEADSPFLNTADDTVERLSADSLAKTGKMILYLLATTGTPR
jgi:hypothetical protein